MGFRILVLFALVSFVASEVKYEYTEGAKKCITEVGADEDTIRGLVKERDPIPEDNELVQKFFACCFRGFINDSNELVVDEKYMGYMTNAFAIRLEGRRKLAELLARDCVEHCKHIKGASKGVTGIKIMNCLKDRFHEYIDK